MSSSFFNLEEKPVQSGAVALADSPSELVKHAGFSSKHLDEQRDLIVYLPPGYEAAENEELRYPVLYLHDGQNLFDPQTAYVPGMDWKVNETADQLISEGAVEPLIIVGIYNTGKKRIEEYTPTPDKKLGGGHADLYGRMLVEEIKPFIDRKYRTLSDPSRTGLGGSSLGGLVTLFLGMSYPDVFGRLAVLSPSVWWNNKVILEYIDQATPKPRLKIWLDIGSKEEKRAVHDAKLLRDVLVRKGWRLGDDLQFMEAEGAVHNEAAWAERVAPMLKFLFAQS